MTSHTPESRTTGAITPAADALDDGGTPAPRGRTVGERGQAAVELVGVVFVVLLVALLSIQGITVAQTASITQEAARNGARALSQGDDWHAVVENQIPDGLELEEAESVTEGGTARVRVTVSAPLGLGEMTVTDVSLTRSADFPLDGLPDGAGDEPAPTDEPTGEDT
ncbi:TadE/TadG family type IV pilus assembly protein [Myceligenerans xiligouense]|uniref:TadE-like protein n=1 Tax=Myceligenerans xiligouense TaxID=253184 RepID=A0A3N4YRV1_9MICO|nr:TadE/TadG family type IV pilus assembly protein [Myceligenerans xiligouense]RPF22937.1 TadE-like protein [Myceligenerans xiligouense]